MRTQTPARRTARRLTLRITVDAMMIALYFVLARFVSIDLPLAQFSVSSLPIFICAFLFGPVDTLAVSLIGSFLEQALSQYGLSPTTPLWMAPVVILGLFVSLCVWATRRTEKKWVIILITVTAELLFTAANTAALYADGYIWHYSVGALTALLPGRLFTALLRMIVTVPLTVFLLTPIRLMAERRGLLPEKNPSHEEPQTPPQQKDDDFEWQNPTI